MATETPAAPVKTSALRVVVTDFDMPFGSMVGFMIKWTLAAIPAFLILSIVGFAAFALLTGFLTAAYQ